MSANLLHSIVRALNILMRRSICCVLAMIRHIVSEASAGDEAMMTGVVIVDKKRLL
jgi:hypothetical protein